MMSRMASYPLLLALSCTLLPAPAAHAEEVVRAYNSYGGAPYVMGKQGLAPELVSYLNRKLKDQYQFRLVNLPRRKLNQLMAAPAGLDGVALFLSPAFVGDVPRQRFHWSPAIIEDSNAVVSRIDNPVRDTTPEALTGLRFAGIIGNRYPGIDERIGKGIRRDNGPDAASNLRKLVRGEADFTVLPLSSYRFLRRQLDREGQLAGQLHVADRPHMQFTRHFVLAHGNSALAREIDRVAAAMPCDPDWRRIAERHHFTTATGCR